MRLECRLALDLSGAWRWRYRMAPLLRICDGHFWTCGSSGTLQSPFFQCLKTSVVLLLQVEHFKKESFNLLVLRSHRLRHEHLPALCRELKALQLSFESRD